MGNRTEYILLLSSWTWMLSGISTGCGSADVTVVSGDAYDNRFAVKNLLTNANQEIFGQNYWIGPDGTASFILNLGCRQTFDGIKLVNTHNGQARDRATKQFKLFSSQTASGPWTQVLDTQLGDSRQQQDPLPLQMIALDTQTTARFVKLELLSWWGDGGGLQYFGIHRVKEDNLVFSVCGFSNNQGNKIGQVTYDRYFSNTNGFEPETGAVAAPSEGIYLVNFYSHIDSGTPTFQTIQDPKDYYSAYIRLNGQNLEFEGHLKSSLVGNNENQDDVTTGRNLVLHLNEGDEVDVGLDKVMPNGAGLTHSSFCMVEIARTKRNAIYSCGFKSTHGNKIGVVTYDRHLTNRNGFGKEESLDLNQGSFVAPVEGVYLINFDTHFETGRGPTSKDDKFNVVFRKNGHNILEQLSIRTSMHGSDDNHDDVTTGRSITLHLNKYDQIDVFVEEVIPVGAGLTHSSFCVTLIHLVEADTEASAFCGFMSGPVNSEGVLTYDRVFTRVDEYDYGGLNRQTGVFMAPTIGTYLVNFDTQVDSGPGPSVTSKPEYYSAYIRKNGNQLQFEGHVKSSVVGTDGFHVDVITGRSLVLHLMRSDEIDIEVNNIMVDGKGFYNATFCVTLIRADKDEIEE
eukprot:GFUD01028787.1.p1 GENE.GFUD01028787.1~~GFUD01028787.1.p1  ORF type:complete len:626 (+),score=118.16 GFUD01028787.1:104-1981(+)